MSVLGTRGESHSASARYGPSLKQTRAVSFPKQLLCFSLGIRAPENRGLAAEMFFLDVVAGGVNNAVLEL